MMALRANVLARGHSAVRVELIESAGDDVERSSETEPVAST